jgi:Skp family chaperone for outer membrane proteins
MKAIVLFSVLMLSCFWVSAPQADTYSWVDENGVKHFSSDPPPKGVPYKKVGEEITSDVSVDAETQAAETKALDALLNELEETDKKNAEAEKLKREADIQSGANKPPTRQEIIQKEKEKLEDTLKHLESLPPESFANSRSRNVIIGQYQYKLSQLNSSPAKYFGWQE